MEHKDFRLKIKALTEDGSFEGYAAIFGSVDRDNEIIAPGAFDRTVKGRNGESVPVLWQHQTTMPVGAGHLSVDSRGLLIKGQFLLATQGGREAYEFAKAGVVRGLSIGYQVVQAGWDGGKRLLKELSVLEVSFATIPAHPEASVYAVKHCDNCPNATTADSAESAPEPALPDPPALPQEGLAIKASDPDQIHSLAVVLDALTVSAIAIKELRTHD